MSLLPPEKPSWRLRAAIVAVVVAGVLEVHFPVGSVGSVACRVVVALGAAFGIYSRGAPKS